MSYTTKPFELSAEQKHYLDQQLTYVSRSFALLIPFLEPPLRYYLAVAYLLCRVADNIEDCGEGAGWKVARFAELNRLLEHPNEAARQLAAWEQAPWPALSEHERRMMGSIDGLLLWQIYARIPAESQAVIRHWVGAMVQGMSQLDDPNQRPYFVAREGIDILKAEEDYNEYCYYVAGTVGRMATELVVEQYRLEDDVAQELRARADSCGRSLQKTNIVKDFAEDVTRGVCYLPDSWVSQAAYKPLSLRGAERDWSARVLTDVLAELRASVDYVVALPKRAAGYRRASLLCLLPAYQTMLLASQKHDVLFTDQHQIKISRPTMAQCVAESQMILHDDQSIRRYGERMERAIYQNLDQPTKQLRS